MNKSPKKQMNKSPKQQMTSNSGNKKQPISHE